MKSCLVTGGAGFIGSSVSEKLIELGIKVIIIDNFCDFYNPKIKNKNIEDLKKVKSLKDINIDDCIKVYKGDIRDRNILKKIFDKNEIDTVIHFAAMAGVRSSIENPVLYQEVNCIGTQNLLEEMRVHDVKKLVMASSSSVYGNCKQIPFKEDMSVDFSISPYAATKKANEVMTHVYHKLFNFNVIMLRLFTVYGPKQRPDLAISKFTRLMTENKEIPMYGNGTTIRDYTYIDDIVEGVIKACNYVQNNYDVYEVINLGSSRPISLLDMINNISEILEIKPNIKHMEMQLGDVERTFADISKAENILNYKPKIKFKDGLINFINWYKENKDRYI